MILIEPLLLHAFGTTPGKALLGISVLDKAGRKPTFKQSFFRLFRVAFNGYGLLIPLYSIYRMYINYKECKEHSIMVWDKRNHLITTLRDKNAARLVIAALFNILLAFLIGFTTSVAFMPQYRGNISAVQFQNNVERYARLHGMLLRSDSSVVRPPFRIPPNLNIVETDGVVTEISFEIVDGNFGDVWGLEHWIRAYAVSFAGAQPGANFRNVYLANDSLLSEMFPDGLWFGWVHKSHHHIFLGIEITYHFEVDGIADWTASTPDSVINTRFHMRAKP
jgi:hypothetical protein